MYFRGTRDSVDVRPLAFRVAGLCVCRPAVCLCFCIARARSADPHLYRLEIVHTLMSWDHLQKVAGAKGKQIAPARGSLRFCHSLSLCIVLLRLLACLSVQLLHSLSDSVAPFSDVADARQTHRLGYSLRGSGSSCKRSYPGKGYRSAPSHSRLLLTILYGSAASIDSLIVKLSLDPFNLRAQSAQWFPKPR